MEKLIITVCTKENEVLMMSEEPIETKYAVHEAIDLVQSAIKILEARKLDPMT